MKKILTSGNMPFAWALTFIISVLLVFGACKKPQYTLATTEDVNLTGYLEKFPDQFSLFSQIIERSGSAGFLAAYGTYTLFSPTNEAVNEWLKSINKSSVNDLTEDELKKVVNYHLITDTLSTRTFTDGKISRLTVYGQYLTTRAALINGRTSYVVNKTAKIALGNVRVGNGIIHVVDHVLVPPSKTLAQLITDKGARYDMFKQALIATGFYDKLNDPAYKFYTVIAESDSALKKTFPGGFTEMKQKLSGTGGNPLNMSDSLNLYVAYHVIPGVNYVADVTSASSLTTLAPSEIISTKFEGLKVLLNEVEFNGAIEPGAEINRTYSDVAASNGVLLESATFFKIKFRVPTPLYWDLGELEPIKNHPNYLKGQIDLGKGALLTSIDPNYYVAERYVGGQETFYYYNVLTNPRWANKNDHLELSLIIPANARPLWQQFRTPLIVKGLYKVWICYPDNKANGIKFQWTMDPGTPNEQVLPTIMTETEKLDAPGVNLSAVNSDALLEGAGYKRYMAVTTDKAIDASGNLISGSVPVTTTQEVGKLAGIANIKTTDRHWIRVTTISGGGQRVLPLDMIHFIPVNMDQQYPRFSPSGTVFKRNGP